MRETKTIPDPNRKLQIAALVIDTPLQTADKTIWVHVWGVPHGEVMVVCGSGQSLKEFMVEVESSC